MGRLTSASTGTAKDDASGRIRCGPCRYQTVCDAMDRDISEKDSGVGNASWYGA